MQLRSGIAMAMVQAGSCSSPIRLLAWEIPCALGVALKRQRKKKNLGEPPTRINIKTRKTNTQTNKQTNKQTKKNKEKANQRGGENIL